MAKAVGAKLLINPAWCKGCGICVAFCPRRVLELDGHGKAVATHLDDCNACGLCERMCPDLAIGVECDTPKADRSSQPEA